MPCIQQGDFVTYSLLHSVSRIICRVSDWIRVFPIEVCISRMFHHYGSLKRVIAIFGMALLLSSSLQQTRVFCFLAGCAPKSCGAQPGQGELGGHACSGRDCPFSRAHRELHQPCDALPADSCVDALFDSCPTSCPCPPACWCHQSPEPFELPRTATVSIELVDLGPVYSDMTIDGSTLSSQCRRERAISVLNASAMSAAEVCAHLSRFLA